MQLAKYLVLAAATALAAPVYAQPPVTVALDWTPNTNHAGLYIAQELGYYEDAGLSVEILPYSDTSSGTLIANSIADFGITSTLTVYSQRAAGSDIMGVFAVVQKETGRVVFNADRTDIETPADLDGLTYGGFGTGWEDALLQAIIGNAGGAGEFETVTLGTSAYEALANGAIDFTLEVYTWEGVHAELQGRAQKGFAYADYGVPEEHTTLLGASQAWLEDNPERAEAFLKATERGYAYAAQNPEKAADLLIAANPATLTDADLVHASMTLMAEDNYFATQDGTVGLMDAAKMEDMGRFMFEAGLLRDAEGNVLDAMPDFSAYYTNSFLK